MQKNISRNTVAPAAAAPELKAHTLTIVPVKAAAISDKQITIDIDDLLPQIPGNFLKTDPRAGAKKPLLFSTYELLPFLSQGKATTPLARIAQMLPEFFNGTPIPADAQVDLPLQKIVAQIGVFPGRPDQVEEIYPPLDERYAKLVVEKGGDAVLPPARIESPAAAVQAPATPKVEAEAPIIPAPAKEEEKAPAEITSAAPVTAVASAAEASAPEEKPAPVEAGTNGSAANHVEEQAAIETVSYSLASIFPNVPKSWIAADLKSVDGAARITVPFDLVEVQLATGKVELAFADFIQGLPENLKNRFPGSKEEGTAAKVLIPLNEVFQNLPGVEPLPPPVKPLHLEPEDEIESEHVSEIEEPKAEVTPEVEKPEPVVEKVPESVVEEVKPPVEEAIVPPVENLQPTPEPVPVIQVSEPVAAAPAPVVEATPAASVEAKAPSAPIVVPLEITKQPEAVQAPVVESKPESAPVKQEPVAVVENVAASVPEPAAPSIPEPAAPEPIAPEPPKVAIVPPPLSAYVEPEQRFVPFISPHIQVQRMAPPSLLKEIPPPSYDAIQQEAVAAKAPAPVEPVNTPVEQVIASEPVAATVEPAAPAEPATAMHPAVKDLIVTDGKLDTRKTVEHVILLPGVKAAALTIKGKTKTTGVIPGDFHAQDMGKAASLLFQALETHAPKGSPGTARAITLHHDQFSSTYFKQTGVMLCILHEQRSLEAAPHNALLLVMQEIVRLRQH